MPELFVTYIGYRPPDVLVFGWKAIIYNEKVDGQALEQISMELQKITGLKDLCVTGFRRMEE